MRRRREERGGAGNIRWEEGGMAGNSWLVPADKGSSAGGSRKCLFPVLCEAITFKLHSQY